MIHFNKIFTLFLAISALLISCSDEELVDKRIKVTEGIPVTVSLPFGTHETTKIETRATDISKDNDVNSLAVVVFREQSDGTIKKEGETMFFDNPSGSVKLKTKSGYNYIYAIANYTSSLFDLKEQLENVSTVEDIQNLKIQLPKNNLSVLDDQYLMSGWFVADDKTILSKEGECLIYADGTISIGHIDLKHVMASITFNIKNGSNSGSFIADSWQVKSVPQSSFLLEKEEDFKGEKETDYFDSQVSSTFKKENEVYNFSFLMMENRKDINTTDGAPTFWDEREKMVYNQDSPEKQFVYADPRSTYVILKGTYTGTTDFEIKEDTGTKEVMAYTTYYIHLGDWRNDNWTDYKIFRNNRYIYTVTVIGVDKLLVEVTEDKQSWGSDGEMYLSSSNVTTFDAHFGTTVISFKKDEMEALAAGISEDEFVEKFIILAATPKNSFVANEEDLDWVTYRRNANDENRKSFAKYKSTDPVYNSQLLNADSFKRDLYRSVTTDVIPDPYDSEGKIYYTCFIDEYFYYADDQKTIPADYSMFINQSPRTIQISSDYLTSDEQSSDSSINLATYVFTQKSIWTIYNMENMHEINAWGTESVMEGLTVLPTTVVKDYGNTDLLQGRKNLLNFYDEFGFSKEWDDAVNYQTNEMKEDFKTSFYACLNRNRDLNGNGKIDEDEMRWYLPSINQYMGYWMGVDVLPEEVRLHTGNQRLDDASNPYIYLSSTAQYTTVNGKGRWSSVVLWASAGSSTGQAVDAAGSNTTREFPYRCVRNLKDVARDVDDFVVSTGSLSGNDHESKTYRYFTNKYLNPRAIRANVTLPLASNHTHLDEENRLPFEFEIGTINGSSCSWENVPSSPCPSGWRLPNQREISIIAYHRMDQSSENVNLHSATKSGLYENGSLEKKRAYYYNGKVVLRPWADGIKAYYRCVKDVEK